MWEKIILLRYVEQLDLNRIESEKTPRRSPPQPSTLSPPLSLPRTSGNLAKLKLLQP